MVGEWGLLICAIGSRVSGLSQASQSEAYGDTPSTLELSADEWSGSELFTVVGIWFDIRTEQPIASPTTAVKWLLPSLARGHVGLESADGGLGWRSCMRSQYKPARRRW